MQIQASRMRIENCDFCNQNLLNIVSCLRYGEVFRFFVAGLPGFYWFGERRVLQDFYSL